MSYTNGDRVVRIAGSHSDPFVKIGVEGTVVAVDLTSDLIRIKWDAESLWPMSYFLNYGGSSISASQMFEKVEPNEWEGNLELL